MVETDRKRYDIINIIQSEFMEENDYGTNKNNP